MVVMPFESTKPKKNLSEILSLMRASDEGMLDLSPEEMLQLGADGEVKVDGYYHMITKYLSESARLASIAKNFANAAAAHAAQADRMKNALCYHMRENGYASLPGQDWKVSLRASQKVAMKIPVPVPTAEQALQYADYVRVKYEWNKVALKTGLEFGDEIAIKVACLEESYWPDFDVKGLKA